MISKLEERNREERNKVHGNNTRQRALMYPRKYQRENPHFKQQPLRAIN